MITLKNVRKSYNNNVIFEDVNITFKEGTVTALVGHNGCGKSTLLKVTSQLIKENSGTITYDKNYKIAYVPEKFPSLSMTARKYLQNIARIDGIYEKKEYDEMICALANDFFMEKMLDKPMKNLSKGTLQKVGVIQALISKPEVLLLDEPLSGQDIESQKVFIEKIKKLRDKGVIVLLSAHEPELINALADEVYIIVDGRVQKQDSPIGGIHEDN